MGVVAGGNIGKDWCDVKSPSNVDEVVVLVEWDFGLRQAWDEFAFLDDLVVPLEQKSVCLFAAWW